MLGRKILGFLATSYAFFVKYRSYLAIFAHQWSQLARCGHKWPPLPLSDQV